MSGIGEVIAWVVPAALGSGVLSSLITTYATQASERNKARADVRQTMRAAQFASHKFETKISDLQETQDEFIRAAQLAHLPTDLVDLYVCAQEMVWRALHTAEDQWTNPTPQVSAAETAIRVRQEAFRLLVEATWRPHLSKVKVWRETRRYRRILVGGIPELDREFAPSKSAARAWEHDMLRKERRERKTRRRLKPAGTPSTSPALDERAALSGRPVETK